MKIKKVNEFVDTNNETADVKVGDTIHIVNMKGEPRYTDKEGKVTHIDAIGQLHGTWGGLAVIPGEDEFYVVEENA